MLPDMAPANNSALCTENSVSFLYDGDIKVLIAELNQLPITDMTVTEPELEEIFLHYYTKEADVL